MRIRCISDVGRSVPAEYLDPRANLGPATQFPLTVGKKYTVYALGFRAGGVWYYLCDDHNLPWPIPYPAPLFDVVDGRVSQLWQYAFTPDNKDHVAILAPVEWSRDAYFYDRLTDGAEREVALFRDVRRTMDGEAAA